MFAMFSALKDTPVVPSACVFVFECMCQCVSWLPQHITVRDHNACIRTRLSNWNIIIMSETPARSRHAHTHHTPSM